MECKICKKEIVPPECYWESYDCCSACIRKVALEIQSKCPECGEIRIDDDRVKAGMKCGFCAY